MRWKATIAALQKLPFSDREREDITVSLMEVVIRPAGKRGGKGSQSVSLKPTGYTEDIVQNISNEYVSQYFRRMFISYCQKPFSQREQIVFRENYNQLSTCCESHQPVFFSTTWHPHEIHEVIPFSLCAGVEEMFNYLLCQEENKETHRLEARAYALRRIRRVNLSKIERGFAPDVKRHLEAMRRLGPQYAINDDEEVCVRLSEKGLENYKRIYFGKPKYDRMEEHRDGYYQYYRCSKDQLFLYFRRFDPDTVEILSPPTLRKRMKDFFSHGVAVYSQREE